MRYNGEATNAVEPRVPLPIPYLSSLTGFMYHVDVA